MSEYADALVVFGVTGDLAKKKLFRALQALAGRDQLRGPVVGVALPGSDGGDLAALARTGIEQHGHLDENAFAKLAQRLSFVGGRYEDASTYQALEAALAGAQHPVYYLAIPPSLFGTVSDGLATSRSLADAKIVVEKPFGRDLPSAVELNKVLARHFTEDRIFRIDHFLGKEAVQNLLYFRFANSLFEPAWCRSHVQSVHIDMAESFGVAGRGSFYDTVGAIRDVVQNHLLQIVTLLAMDPPSSVDANAIGRARLNVLEAVRPLSRGDVVLGQYEGYLDEPGVKAGSTTETFVAARFEIDSWRWSGVPFYVRTGKSLARTATEVRVVFRRPPAAIFGRTEPENSNYLRFRLGPDVFIALGARIKKPGDEFEGVEAELLATHIQVDAIDAYERLLGDALEGDQTLFSSQAAVEAAWRVVDPLLADSPGPLTYSQGGWGPTEAMRVLCDGDEWPEPSDLGPVVPPSGGRVAQVPGWGLTPGDVGRILVVDVGGTHVKVHVSGAAPFVPIDSGPAMTPDLMVAAVRAAASGVHFEKVAIGYPGPVLHGRPVMDPHNLGPGWVGFDFERAFGAPIRILNDAAMQALGSYEGGSMLFLGFGTGLGTALIIDGVIEPLELAHLPYKNGKSFEEYVGAAGLERLGHEKWSKHVHDVIDRLAAALQSDYVVVGGGNARRLTGLPAGVRIVDNDRAFAGGERLWGPARTSSV